MRAISSLELLTAADAETRQRRAAASLLRAGLQQGDRVAFCLSSSAALLCAVLGAARIGVVPVLLQAALTAAERDALLRDADPQLQVLDDATLASLEGDEETDLAHYPLTRAMHYTSGTTGHPKGVFTGIWDEETASAVFADEADLWRFGPGDLHLVCSPMYHTVSVRFAGGTLLSGGNLVILRRFDAASTLRVLRHHRPTTTFMVPTHIQRLLALDDLGPSERFSSLRLLAHAGAPCPPALKEAVMARVDPGVVWEFYGSTEGQFTVCSPEEWRERPGTVGRARPGRRIRIDGEGAGAAPGEVGTIWCEAPPFARFSYWRNPEATAAAWRGDAFTVGDAGHLDEDGYLFLSGRRHDLIITGGVNVYPAEVENAFSGLPGVAEVAVFGRTDPEWGQRVCTALVPAPGANVDLEAIRAVARERLAPAKRPKEYVIASELPHTSTGKLLRRDVAAHLGLEE